MKNKPLIFAALLGLTLAASPMAFAGGGSSNKSHAQDRQTTGGQQRSHSMSNTKGRQTTGGQQRGQSVPNKQGRQTTGGQQRSHSGKNK